MGESEKELLGERESEVNRQRSWERPCDRKSAAGAATTEPGHRGRERESLPCSKSSENQL